MTQLDVTEWPDRAPWIGPAFARLSGTIPADQAVWGNLRWLRNRVCDNSHRLVNEKRGIYRIDLLRSEIFGCAGVHRIRQWEQCSLCRPARRVLFPSRELFSFRPRFALQVLRAQPVPDSQTCLFGPEAESEAHSSSPATPAAY